MKQTSSQNMPIVTLHAPFCLLVLDNEMRRKRHYDTEKVEKKSKHD